MKKIVLGIAVVVVAIGVAHWYYSDRGRFTTAPEYTDLAREVAGNEIRSDHDPAVVLRFAPEFRYLGAQKFILYGVADTEQYLYVATTPDDELRSVYWVQFEAYLPDNSYSYDYDDSPLRVDMSGFEFYTDTAFFGFDPDRKRKRGTDGAMMRQLLAQHGYTLPREVVYARLVYLTDESRRKELMIIVMDDLAARHGTRAAALEDGGADAERWPQIEQAHLDWIRATLDVSAP